MGWRSVHGANLSLGCTRKSREIGSVSRLRLYIPHVIKGCYEIIEGEPSSGLFDLMKTGQELHSRNGWSKYKAICIIISILLRSTSLS